MSSERRTQSSRANGAKSRGPKTPEGKRVSAQNGTRHGLVAATVTLAEENDQSFLLLIRTLEETFHPRDEFDKACIETMAISRWRGFRILGMETAAIQHEIDRLNTPEDDPATCAALAFRSLGDNSRCLDLLDRYETRYDRMFARAYNLLTKRKFPNKRVLSL